MNRSIIEHLEKSNIIITESFDWKNSTLYIHKLTSTNPYLEEQLQELKKLNIITDPKNVYIYSFVHPDVEFCMSFTCGDLINKPFERPAWISYVDPTKLLINKRQLQSGFSLEKITSPSFTTTMFLSNGSNVTFTSVNQLSCKIISTTAPLVVLVLAFLYNHFRINIIDPKNPFPVKNISWIGFKVFSLPQLLTRANYYFVRNMKATS